MRTKILSDILAAAALWGRAQSTCFIHVRQNSCAHGRSLVCTPLLGRVHIVSWPCAHGREWFLTA